MDGRIVKIMQGATQRFAKKESVANKSIAFVVHTKNENLSPEYSYMVDRKVKKDEEGKQVKLNFTRDILNKLFDPVMPAMVGNFFSMKFDYYARLKEIDPRTIYFIIYPLNEDVSQFGVVVNGGGQEIETMELSEIFKTN